MRLVCPGCATVYVVEDALLTPSRPVRCNRCHVSWSAEAAVASPVMSPNMAVSAEPEAAAAEVAIPAAPMELLPGEKLELRRPAQRAPMLALAWAGSVVLVVAALAGLVVAHRAVAAAWPPMQRLYAVVGLRAV